MGAIGPWLCHSFFFDDPGDKFGPAVLFPPPPKIAPPLPHQQNVKSNGLKVSGPLFGQKSVSFLITPSFSLGQSGVQGPLPLPSPLRNGGLSLGQGTAFSLSFPFSSPVLKTDTKVANNHVVGEPPPPWLFEPFFCPTNFFVALFLPRPAIYPFGKFRGAKSGLWWVFFRRYLPSSPLSSFVSLFTGE